MTNNQYYGSNMYKMWQHGKLSDLDNYETNFERITRTLG